MNRVSTFKGWKEQKGGFTRYISMALVTLALDNFLLFLLVRYGNLPYMLAAVFAILINFILRYLIARNWVWNKKAPLKA
jgi:putative flippase GtrA